MKTLRNFCVALVLTLSIALSSYAGDISAPGATAAPLPRQESSLTGDISAPGAVKLDPLTAFTVNLLQGLLSLF